MGCFGSKAAKACAEAELAAAQARFPATEVEGTSEKLGMGRAEKQFDSISSFTWTLGGTGEVKIGKVMKLILKLINKQIPLHYNQTISDKPNTAHHTRSKT